MGRHYSRRKSENLGLKRFPGMKNKGLVEKGSPLNAWVEGDEYFLNSTKEAKQPRFSAGGGLPGERATGFGHGFRAMEHQERADGTITLENLPVALFGGYFFLFGTTLRGHSR